MEVRINNEKIDTSSAVVAISKQGFDFSDLRKRFLGRTNRFVLPRTGINTRIFESPLIVNTGGRGFEKTYDCVVVDQGVTLLNGTGILQEAGQDFKLQVVDKAKEFFDGINTSLRDLEWDDYDFEFNNTSYLALNPKTNSVWLWAADNQFNNFNPGDYFNYVLAGETPIITYYRPHLLVSRLFRDIFETGGWSYVNGDKLDNYIISVNHEQFYFTSYEKIFGFQVGGAISELKLELTGQDFSVPDVFVSQFEINVQPYNQLFRIRGKVQVTGNWQLTVKSIRPGENSEEIFDIREGDEFIDFTTSLFQAEDNSNNISFTLSGSGNLKWEGVRIYSLVEESDFGDWNPNNEPPDILVPPFQDYLVKTHDNVPDINQLDLFKEICLLTGLGFRTNDVTKEVVFFDYSDISRSNYVDWSDKFIKDSETVRPPINGLGKTTFLEYSNDDITNPDTGKGSLNVDNENIPDRSVLISSLFSGSLEYFFSPTFGGSRQLVSAMQVYGNNGRVAQAGIRIKAIAEVTELVLSDWKASFNKLRWPTLQENEYRFILKALEKGRIIKAQFELSKLDVVSFDFSKLVYIQQLKSYFLVVDIQNYIAGRTTTVELLKVK